MKPYRRTKSDLSARRILRNWLISVLVLAFAWGLCRVMRAPADTDVYVPLIFVLAVLVVSLLTDGYFYGILASLVSVLGVNWAFTYPYMALDFSIAGYPTTFITMLAVSVVISTLTTRVREHEKLRHEAEKAKLRSDLLRSVSHDLRTPLTSISGSISTVLSEGEHLSHEQRTLLLSDAKQDAEWLIRMVENLLSITRISGDETAGIRKSPELLEEIVGECTQNFKKRNPDIILSVAAPSEPIIVNVDAMLIEQVLMNLMDNSVHHGKTLTKVELNINRFDDYVEIAVSDDGVGIDPKIISGIFKGQIAPTDNNRFRGIGLAVCKTIVNAHGGRIDADNLPHGGAIFKFTLPVQEDFHEHQG